MKTTTVKETKGISLKDLLKDYDLEPKAARKILRADGARARGRWLFTLEEVEVVKEKLGLIQKPEPKKKPAKSLFPQAKTEEALVTSPEPKAA